MKATPYDMIVIGAGVAGGVFAASQPEDRKILVIERDLSERDRIVGELMQPGGILALKKLNLGHLLEGIDAQEIEGYCLIKGDQKFAIKYCDVEGGVNGLGLRNGKFLSNIRKYLEQRKHTTLLQGNVTQLIEDNGKITGVVYKNKEGTFTEASAHLTVVCDGPMSSLREQLCMEKKEISSFFIGLTLKDIDIEFPSFGQMILTGDFPILVYPTHTGSYRILIDSPGETPPKLGKQSIDKWVKKVVDVLPQELKYPFLSAVENDRLKMMPNHAMKGQALQKNGAVLLGDSLNMRHPLTGSGMTAIFNDILCLNKNLRNIPFYDFKKVGGVLNNYYMERGKGVEAINILANSLYKVFINKGLKEACLEYLKKGGEQASGPLSFLSGLNKDKASLLKHFHKVVVQHPFHFITKPKKQLLLYKEATKIIRKASKLESRPPIVR